MRIKSLRIHNLLTFEGFHLELEGQTQTIVGPNGSGKSNIVRSIDLVTKALDWCAATSLMQYADQVLRSFAAAHRHRGEVERPAVVRLSIELTTPNERLRLTSFIKAAILVTLIDELHASSDDETKSTLSHWVESEITTDRLAPLMSGDIVLVHQGLPHVPWRVGYEFATGDDRALWNMSLANPFGITSASEPPVPHAGAQTIPLSQRTLGIDASASSAPQPLPNELPPFDMRALFPGAGQVIMPPQIRTQSGTFDYQIPTFRRAVELLGLPSEPSGGQHIYPLAYALSILLNDGIRIFGEQFRGLGLGGAPSQRPGPYPWEALTSILVGHTPSSLPLRLFQLKAGDRPGREKYTAIQRVFSELAPGRSFEVCFEAVSIEAMSPASIGAGQVTIFPGHEPQKTPQPGAAITVVVNHVPRTDVFPEDLPIQLHGGGTWEALVIAEALVEASSRVVVLDEPALTLHPTWQRFLRTRIKEAAGQFIVITHSPNLVSLDSRATVHRLVRIENESGRTRPHRFPDALAEDDLNRIIREFSLSTEATSLLFARAVVLLEGETELGALPRWFDNYWRRERGERPADLDLAFYSVGGDANFTPMVRVLSSLQIPWVLICDGAAFDIERRGRRLPHVFRQVLDADPELSDLREFLEPAGDCQPPAVMNTATFDIEKEIGRRNGILTLAVGWKTADRATGTLNDESFEAFLNLHLPRALEEAEDQVGSSKVRKGLWIAEHYEYPPDVGQLFHALVRCLTQRGLNVQV